LAKPIQSNNDSFQDAGMSVRIVHEDDAQEIALPGRRMRWLINAELLNSQHMSVCMIRVAPGERVRPAHSHPNGEEAIHIISGSGRVLVEGEISAVRAGSTVLFPQGSVHMLHNTGPKEMKVICFFAPATNLDNYKLFEGIDFPDSESESVTKA
jgi:quercetin dioxygenase-like cupin family protein